MENGLEKKRTTLEETVIVYEKLQNLAWAGWLFIILGAILLGVSITILPDMAIVILSIVVIAGGGVLAIVPWYCQIKLPSLRRQLETLEMPPQVRKTRLPPSVVDEIRYCRYCGQIVSIDSSFCEKCGKKLIEN